MERAILARGNATLSLVVRDLEPAHPRDASGIAR